MNINKPAIVVATYNRAHSFERLLGMLDRAHYPDHDIQLVISVDGGGTEDVKQLAASFEWRHGSKDVICHERNLGLREHILRCGDLTQKYGSIIMLEDDLGVSPAFYGYSASALAYYGEDADIAGVSLYNQPLCTSGWRPFEAVADGWDNYFLQYASSWGQAWTFKQWADFRAWYDCGQSVERKDSIPRVVSNWPESSWLKYFIKYMVMTGRYFAYPRSSYSTNFSEAGTHKVQKTTNFQVSLSLSPKVCFSRLGESESIYDSFFEYDVNLIKKHNPGLRDCDFIVDLYGNKLDEGLCGDSLVLSARSAEEPELSYALELRPHEMNVLMNLHGQGIHLARSTSFLPRQFKDRVLLFKYDQNLSSRKQHFKDFVGTFIYSD